MPRRPNRSKVPKPAPAPKPLNVPQQQADFTAEGAPPPGRVAKGPPELTPGAGGAKAQH